MFNDLLIQLAILILLVESYQKLRQTWLRHIMAQKKKAKRPRKPAVLRPKSERGKLPATAVSVRRTSEKRKRKSAENEMPVAWALRIGNGGLKKKIATGGFFCPNQACEYFGSRDEGIHTLVGYGTHEAHAVIRDIKCQACGKKFTARRNTVMYQLKSHSGMMKKTLLMLGSRVR